MKEREGGGEGREKDECDDSDRIYFLRNAGRWRTRKIWNERHETIKKKGERGYGFLLPPPSPPLPPHGRHGMKTTFWLSPTRAGA